MSGVSADHELYQHDDALVVVIMNDDVRGLEAIAAARRASGRPFDLERACNTPLMMGFSMTPLQLAASEGKARAARELLRLGAAVDGRARKHPLGKDDYPFFFSGFSPTAYYFDSARTPLMMTMYRKIGLLGRDVVPVGLGPSSNLHETRHRVAKEAIARMLIAEGASRLATDSLGMRPVHYAIKVRGGTSGTSGTSGTASRWTVQPEPQSLAVHRAGRAALAGPGAREGQLV